MALVEVTQPPGEKALEPEKPIKNDQKCNSSESSYLSGIWPPRINPALVPLKICLFVWYGGIQGVTSFYILFLKQRGLTVQQLSFANMVVPFFQCMGPLLSGIIADKIGRSKPVLFANLVLVLLALTGFMFIPYVNVPTETDILKTCFTNSTELPKRNLNELADIEETLKSCIIRCPPCIFNGTSCGNLTAKLKYVNEEFANLIDKDSESKGAVHLPNEAVIRCGFPLPHECNVSCDDNVQYQIDNDLQDNTNLVFFLSLFMMILYSTSVSDTFRFMDITTMSMVKAHNSDFGRERFWCITGTILISPLFGYLVQVTTSVDGQTQYATAFYGLMITTVLTTLSAWKIDVTIERPGKKMLQKTIKLLKNPDILAFILCLFFLGTIWAFRIIFAPLFLVELGASSMLISLLPVVGNILGLPFLVTSDWWVRHVGNTNIFLLGFASYAIMCIAYSFLWNPWLALVCEIGVIFTYHLLWVAVIRHSHDIAPEGLVATVLSTAGAIHYGFSKVAGSLTGGLIMSKYGPRVAYRTIAIMAVAAAIAYSTFLYLRKKHKKPHSQEHEMNGK